MLRNEIIPSNKNTQFLGMTFYSRLNWEKHFNKLRAKAKRALNAIRVVAGKKWGGGRTTLKNCTVQHVGQKWTISANYITQLLQE